MNEDIVSERENDTPDSRNDHSKTQPNLFHDYLLEIHLSHFIRHEIAYIKATLKNTKSSQQISSILFTLFKCL